MNENKLMRKDFEVKFPQLEVKNKLLREKCEYLTKTTQGKGEKKSEGTVDESKLNELRDAWKKTNEDEKVSFIELVHNQIEEETKDTVVKVIEEKEAMMRDTLEKKKYVIMFDLQEKKNPARHAREREEKSWQEKSLEQSGRK